MHRLFRMFSFFADSILPCTPERADARRRFGLCKVLAVLCALWAVSSIVAQGQTFTTLDSFNRTNGASPQFESLVQGRDGNSWGTAVRGGTGSCGTPSCGTIFKITPNGKLTTVYNLNPTSGYDPAAGLVLGTDGNFYGVTASGGAIGNGTVFKVTASGILTVLFNFYNAQGTVPVGALTQGTDGNFYGTTTLGGSGSVGTISLCCGCSASP